VCARERFPHRKAAHQARAHRARRARARSSLPAHPPPFALDAACTAPPPPLLVPSTSSSAWETARHALPPVWVDSLDEVNEKIDTIKVKLADLDKAHTKRFMNVVDFSDTGSKDDRHIEMLTDSITDLFREGERALKRVATAKAPDGAEVADAERKIRVNIQRSMAIQLQTLSMDFRKKQKAFMARVKAQKQGGDSTFDFLAQNDTEPDMGFNDDQLAAVDLAEVVVEDRDQEIVQIARSIEELSTIFKELAVLVIDQGTILDRIDYNMEQVVERTKQGMKELVQAEKHQKSSRPLKCIALLIVLICIMIAILVEKHSGKSSSD
jgi:syntaxin 16